VLNLLLTYAAITRNARRPSSVIELERSEFTKVRD
jgi:hypothetical protein